MNTATTPEATRNGAHQPEIVVVTGASAGVGRATVREFVKRGAHIGLIARGRDGLDGACAEVKAAGGKALVLPTDVADADQVEAVAAAVEEQLGPIDVWVNNAMASVFSPMRLSVKKRFTPVTTSVSPIPAVSCE